jgi:hypothetical protein
MIISDLTYLENVSDPPSIVGGYGYTVELNRALVKQEAISCATAFGYKEDSLATAASRNFFDFLQL